VLIRVYTHKYSVNTFSHDASEGVCGLGVELDVKGCCLVKSCYLRLAPSCACEGVEHCLRTWSVVCFLCRATIQWTYRSEDVESCLLLCHVRSCGVLMCTALRVGAGALAFDIVAHSLDDMTDEKINEELNYRSAPQRLSLISPSLPLSLSPLFDSALCASTMPPDE
jgi:hypothetical protein